MTTGIEEFQAIASRWRCVLTHPTPAT